MKKVLLLSSVFLGAVALVGSPSGLTWSCVDGTVSSGHCMPGRVTFAGNGYPTLSHIHVTRNSTSDVYDDFDYNSATGELTFTETLYPADTYTITVSTSNGSAVQTITTGSSDR